MAKLRVVGGGDFSSVLETYFAPRGLDPGELGCRYVTAQEATRLMGYGCAGGILIPYYDAGGRPLIVNGEGFVRIRLWPYEGRSKYRQKGGTGMRIYLTPGVDWARVAADVSIPIMFTEGEMKAAKVCKTEGWPVCIGLGGVDSWGSTRLIPELEEFDWRGRTVYIAYDADIETKSEVKRAQTRLCGVLDAYGAEIKVASIFGTGSAEKGVDDYIVAGGAWEVLLGTAVPGDPSPLARMLAEYAALESGEVINIENGRVQRLRVFHDLKANVLMDGEKGRKLVSRVWQASPKRLDVVSMTLDPREEWGLVRREDRWYFNVWRGWQTRAVRGEYYGEVVERWESFVKAMVGDSEELAKLFHRWVAWIVRNPASRNYTSWIFASRKEGIGKSLLGETVAEMMGCGDGLPARVLQPDDLFHAYPTFAEGPVFAVCNEVQDSGNRHRARMKALRTNDTLKVERKMIQPYYVPNYLNFVISTNEAYAYGMSADSRRDIVVEPIPGNNKTETAEWERWLNDEIVPLKRDRGALECLMWYYSREVDLSGYDPHERAPYTEAKAIMSEASEWGDAGLRSIAREVKEMWGGRGVIPSEWLKNKYGDELKQFEKFCRILREEAGYMPTSEKRVVKVSGSPLRCVIFGADAKDVMALDKPAELERSRSLLGFPVRAVTP